MHTVTQWVVPLVPGYSTSLLSLSYSPHQAVVSVSTGQRLTETGIHYVFSAIVDDISGNYGQRKTVISAARTCLRTHSHTHTRTHYKMQLLPYNNEKAPTYWKDFLRASSTSLSFTSTVPSTLLQLHVSGSHFWPWRHVMPHKRLKRATRTALLLILCLCCLSA